MTNKIINSNLLTDMVKGVIQFCNSIFVSSSAKEFTRLKNFIAS